MLPAILLPLVCAEALQWLRNIPAPTATLPAAQLAFAFLVGLVTPVVLTALQATVSSTDNSKPSLQSVACSVALNFCFACRAFAHVSSLSQEELIPPQIHCVTTDVLHPSVSHSARHTNSKAAFLSSHRIGLVSLCVVVGGSIYSGTKHFIDAFTNSARHDLVGTDIRVTAISPGAVQTEFSKVRYSGDEDKAAAVYNGIIPLTAADVADNVMYAATRYSVAQC